MELSEKLNQLKTLGLLTEAELELLLNNVDAESVNNNIKKENSYKTKWNKAVDEIMGEFDFEKMHNVMVMLKWSWFYDGVPSVSDIKNAALNLFNDLYEVIKDWTTEEKLEARIAYVKTGGLSAEVHFFYEDDDSEETTEELSLTFEAVNYLTDIR